MLSSQSRRLDSTPSVLIGGNPDGLRAAAALSLAGRSVLLLEPGEIPGGRQHGELPERLGCYPLDAPLRALGASLLGDPVPLALEPGLALGGRCWPLPLPPGAGPRMLSARAAAGLRLGALKARGLRRFGDLVGHWTELRSYRDWLVAAYGEEAFSTLYAPYAQRRWGAARALASCLARRHHAAARPAELHAPRLSPHALLERSVAAVERAGGEVLAGVEVRALQLREGRVAALETNQGQLDLAGQLWVSQSPQRVLAWLGDQVPAALGWAGAPLVTRPRLAVALGVHRAPVQGLLHLLDGEHPFHRLLRPELLPGCSALAGQVVLHANLAPEAPLWRAGDAELGAAARRALAACGLQPAGNELRVNRLADDVPIWSLGFHPRWLRLRSQLQAWGVVGVGGAGAFCALDPLQQWRQLEALLADDALPVEEIRRLHGDPPVQDPARVATGFAVG